MTQRGTTGIYLPPIRVVHRSDLRVSDEPGAEFRFGKDKRYKPMEGSIDMETQYHRDYTQKPLVPTKMIQPSRRSENPGTFVGQPTYKDDYKAYDLSSDGRIPRQHEYRPPSKKFEGTSNYSLEYVPHQLTPFRNAKPVQRPTATDEPFPKATSYRDSFPKYSNLVARQQIERPRWQPVLTPMSDSTNYKSDYIQRDLEMRKSYKPDVSPLKSEAVFEDSTTQKTSYVDWKVATPVAQERPIYRTPEGEFDFTTTASLEFTRKPLEKIPSRRPVDVTRSLGSFDGTTNYELEFQSWPLGERTKSLKRTDGFLSDEPFRGKPTYSTDYIPHEVSPRKDHRPNVAPMQTTEPFPTHTDYRDSYVVYQLPDAERQERPAWQPNAVKLDTTTTYQSEFTEREPVKTVNFKPNSAPMHSEEATEYRTTHLDSFTPWKFINDGQLLRTDDRTSHQVASLAEPPSGEIAMAEE